MNPGVRGNALIILVTHSRLDLKLFHCTKRKNGGRVLDLFNLTIIGDSVILSLNEIFEARTVKCKFPINYQSAVFSINWHVSDDFSFSIIEWLPVAEEGHHRID